MPKCCNAGDGGIERRIGYETAVKWASSQPNLNQFGSESWRTGNNIFQLGYALIDRPRLSRTKMSMSMRRQEVET
jgi:hypothetical protein